MLGSLFQKRTCLVPTWRGWIVLLLIAGIAGTFAVRNAYYFLAPQDPTPGGLLVLEGWEPDYVLEETVEELRRNHYDGVVVTGQPIEKGAPLVEYDNYAILTVAVLERMGVNPAMLHVAPWATVRRDRTFASAVALRTWLREHGISGKPINLVCGGAHSRRSRLLYERTLGTKVGVIAIEDQTFDPARWWTSSAGFRSVTDEAIAYIYARFIFQAPHL